MVGAGKQDQKGEFIAIMNRFAYHGKGHTILPSWQMETFGLHVHDRALLAGGRQCIESPDRYCMPFNVIDNPVYTPIGAFSDKEWSTLPHRHSTADTWASNNLNFVMTNVDGWEHTVSTNNINPERHTTIQSIWQI